MNDTIRTVTEKALTAAGGVTGIEVITKGVSSGTVTETVGLVTQIVILVATLFGIFKKKKTNEHNNM